MEVASRALTRLNLETRQYHAAADEGWSRLLHGAVTVRDYIHQLATTYGFEAPVEAALAYTPGLKNVIDVRPRSRAGLLAQDLLALGIKPAGISLLPQCGAITAFAGQLDGLAWMYVLERATLLHDKVRANVRGRLPEAANACAYLSAHDGIANARWNDLGRALDRAAPSQEHVQELCRAAHDAFGCLLDWNRGGRISYARGA